MKNFALIGVGGFVAVKHLKAIKDTGNSLVAALDKFDSVGILDSYFPETQFFTEFERFDRHLDKLRRSGGQIDYLSICTPNYLHDAHIRFALRSGADAICEKPLVLNPWNIDALEVIERESGKKVNTILQLRLHPVIKALKQQIDNQAEHKKFELDLTYITSRGSWYFSSWKAVEEKSGGVATNIGIHFFDMLTWLFGKCTQNTVHYRDERTVAGYLELNRARVRWFLSVDANTLPAEVRARGARTYRSILLDGQEIEFSEGFTELHNHSYQEVLAGRGFGLSEARTSIEIVSAIRQTTPIGLTGDYHPLLLNVLK